MIWLYLLLAVTGFTSGITKDKDLKEFCNSVLVLVLCCVVVYYL